MESGFLLDIVVRESSSVFELLSSKDKCLLIGRDAFFVLDLSLDVVDSVGWFDVEGDGLASEGLDKDLHATSESKDEMESRFLLDVVVGEGSTVFELLSSEDESLLIGRDSFFVLDLGLDVVDGVGWLDVEGNGLASESLDKDLHATSESKDEMESGFLLDVVVGEGSSVFELFSSKDESLLIGRDSFFVLDLSLDIVDGVRWLDVEGNGFTSECFNEDLHFESYF